MSEIVNYLRRCISKTDYFDYPLYFPENKSLDQYATPVKQAVPRTRAKPKPAVSLLTDPKYKQFIKPNGGLTAHSAANIVRVMGAAPTQRDIEQFEKSNSWSKIKEDTIVQWKTQLETKYAETDTPSLLADVTRNIDIAVTGKLTGHQLYTLLTNYGEALSSEEALAILSQMGIENTMTSEVDMLKFCSQLCT